jgi:predicted nucleotidyltransferase
VNPNDPNVAIVHTVAHALGPLCDDLVFVGGCAIGLLITDPGRPAVRATNDVDLIAEVTTKADYYALAKRLKERGFVEEGGEIICRWKFGNVIVDVMPIDESVLGFSNRWYFEAVRQADTVDISNEIRIKLVSAPLLLATKIEAFYGRGNNDYAASHDIEDIVTLVDGRPELLKEISEAEGGVREYLESEIDDLLSERAFVEAIPYHLGHADHERVPSIIESFRKIAGL